MQQSILDFAQGRNAPKLCRAARDCMLLNRRCSFGNSYSRAPHGAHEKNAVMLRAPHPHFHARGNAVATAARIERRQRDLNEKEWRWR
jgi:hypothetical protein